MHQLDKIDGLRLEGLISRPQSLAAREVTPTILAIDINIYGKREDAYKAGEILYSSGICLQQPVCDPEQFTYYNPHFLHVEELMGLGPVQETPKFKIDTKTNINTREVKSSSPATPAPEQVDTSTEISNVLSSLSHHAILSKKSGTVALKSELKE